jgi:putative protease
MKPELLAPAGDLERLKIAFAYGADAVYIGGEEFSLRAHADNFTFEDMKEGIEFAHQRGKKVYITANIIPHNHDLSGIEKYLRQVAEIKADAVIVSDPGVLEIAKEAAPGLEIHISTQANNVNWRTINFWHKLGAKRVVLARELSLEEIKEIRDKIPETLELEVFVHGAMCISYSGRCLLSNYMAGRESNLGMCAHPCRWQYYLMEEKRPGEYFPVYENERGTFIFNSKDLCMIEHIPQMIENGIYSMKIEGRMKSSFYVATVVKAYRKAIDEYINNPDSYEFKQEWMQELVKASHRDFTNGFFFKRPGPDAHVYESSSYIREYDFVGLVLDYDEKSKTATVEQRNRMFRGDEIEVVPPKGDYFNQSIVWMKNAEGEEIETAPHAQMIVTMGMARPVEKFTILRRKVQ